MRLLTLLRAVACAAGFAACGYPRLALLGDDASTATCNAGDMRDCYDGAQGTDGVGPCHHGQQRCGTDGAWGACDGEVVPVREVCNDHIDNNCNGMVDEDIDADGDGFTTCGGDCCDSTECSHPAQVNPGAFEVPGNGVDDDCDGKIDNVAPLCDQGLASNSSNALDYAKVIDLCQTATPTDKKWGVIDASFTLADGTGAVAPQSRAIRSHYGTNVVPKAGAAMAMLSTGAAAGVGDINPSYADLQTGTSTGTSSGLPADFVAANGGRLPNAPGCPQPANNTAHDPVMLTLHVRVPTNASSFTLHANFFSSEFPEYTCSQFNDFFAVLLDSAYAGAQPNPSDKNLAFYMGANNDKIPIGVNLAVGNIGLFTQCVNGTLGCATTTFTSVISSCTGVDDLIGTGLDTPAVGMCDGNSVEGGATGWLTISGNVKPGEIMTLRIAIWDASDELLDSLVVVDGFQWSVDIAQPGTLR
jgi:hypothetical protein